MSDDKCPNCNHSPHSGLCGRSDAFTPSGCHCTYYPEIHDHAQMAANRKRATEDQPRPTPDVEVYRKLLMERFADRCSMEQIASAAYILAGVETGAHPSQDARAIEVIENWIRMAEGPDFGSVPSKKTLIELLGYVRDEIKAGTRSTPSLPAQDAEIYLCPDGCGCTWRDNHDGTMSLAGPNSKSCKVCEFLPLKKLIPLLRSSTPSPDPPQNPTVNRCRHGVWRADYCYQCGAAASLDSPAPPDIKPTDLIGVTRAALDQLCNDNSALKAEIGQTTLERDSYKFLRNCTRSALERVLHNFELLLAQKPVRDAAETISEARAALAPSLPTKGEK